MAPAKSPVLYRWIVGTSALLIAALFVSMWPQFRAAFHYDTAAGVVVVISMILVAYLWLNGVQDLFYPLWYHLVLKPRGGLTLPPLHHWNASLPPRVALVYCTCNDFSAESLDASRAQDYPNFEVAILDDSTDPAYLAQVDAYAATHSIRVIRRTDRVGFKAGNLNHGLAQLEWDYFVILDSDEIIPNNFVSRALDYFSGRPDVGVVQGNHVASRNRNRFMERFSIGVDAFWPVYLSVRSHYGFMFLLGHGAMVSRACYDAAGGVPLLVAEDICFSIEARDRGYLTVFAPDIMCQEEFPPDFLAFKKRHGKWTAGNFEFMKVYTGRAMRAKMHWYEKLDIILSAYAISTALLLVSYMVLNVAVLPLIGFHVRYPLWMLVPTLAFIATPAVNDIVVHWRRSKRELLSYVLQCSLLYGAMLPVSLIGTVKALFGQKAVFVVTPKDDQRVGFRLALRANWREFLFGLTLVAVGIACTGSVIAVFLLIIPALTTGYMSVMHQRRTRDQGWSSVSYHGDRTSPELAELERLLV